MFNMLTDLNVERQSSDDYAKAKNLNLSRPSMWKGVKATAELNLSQPAMIKGGNATRPVERPASVGVPHKPLHSSSSSDVKSVDSPNVALRKPDVVQEDDIESDRQSKLRIKPNLVLKMRQDRDEDLSDMTLLKKPEVVQKPLEPRLDSSAKEVVRPTGKVTAPLNAEGLSSEADMGNLVSAEQEEREGNDWKRAEYLLVTGERAEVKLISCSGRGFVVSFGSIVGFLPYRNLGAKWKFLAFESWLRNKGLDPSLYRQNLSIIGSYDTPNKSLVMDFDKSQDINEKDEETLTPNVKFEDLLEAYEKEKTKFLSSFVGQRIKATVLLADRSSRRLIFSGRPKEKEELVEKKRSLMDKLSVGDVVKCCIKKITYFGIFVEVEGVLAFIHQSEVSWDATLDPSSYYKLGQIVEAKVHQLDYALERITFSLKEITPDPLMEALESVVGDRTSLGGNLEAAEADIEGLH